MIPLRGERLAAVAAALREGWDGAALHLVEQAGWNGPRVVELLAATVPGYEDEARAGGHRLRFRKLAHLAAALMSSRSSVRLVGDGDLPGVSRLHAPPASCATGGYCVTRRRCPGR